MAHLHCVSRRLRHPAAALAGLSAICVLLGAHIPTAPLPTHAQTSPTGVAKMHPALLSRLADANGPVKAWVFFTDKGVVSPAARTAAIDQVAATYNPRAIQRRLLRGSADKRAGRVFDERDLPVVPAYRAAVTATGARLGVTSRWLNAVSVTAAREQLEQIAALAFVQRLQPVAQAQRIEPVSVSAALPPPLPNAGLERDRLDYGLATEQLTQINLIALHDAGYTGSGVVIGILDTGFHRAHVAFNNPAHPLNIVAEYDFINDDSNTENQSGDLANQDDHGTYILGTLASCLPGQLVGAAYDAAYILCKTENMASETPVEEDYYVAGLEFIEAHGGDMATSSLGYTAWYSQADFDGQTAVTTIAVNVATANGLHCCASAGNAGHDANPTTAHLGAPADALQVITCGAVYHDGTIASFSSDGPTADGRVKPELLARGVITHTVDPNYDQGYSGVNGTSLSTPLVAGAVACLTQAHPEWTVDQMRDALFHTAGYYVAHRTHDPLYVEGYGIANALATIRDCNQNGTLDWQEIATGASLDCNHNGVPDACDLASGTSADCNANGFLDECDLVEGTSTDVNGNGVLDECEDCNANGTPDEMDIANGTSLDFNGNAIPDECEPAAICPGDLNCDAQVDFGDINAFVRYLSDFAAWQAANPACDPRNGDLDHDGTYPSMGDVNPFVELLSGQRPPIPCDPQQAGPSGSGSRRGL